MRYTALRGERQISDFIRAHFGDLSPSDMKRAKKLLLDLNPELKNLRDLPSGAVIALPKLVQGKVSNDACDPMAAAYVELLDELHQYSGEINGAVTAEEKVVDADTQQFFNDLANFFGEQDGMSPLESGVKQALEQRKAMLSNSQRYAISIPQIREALEQMLY